MRHRELPAAHTLYECLTAAVMPGIAEANYLAHTGHEPDPEPCPCCAAYDVAHNRYPCTVCGHAREEATS